VSSDLKSLTDDELLRHFKNDGEPVFVGELFKRYKHLVFGVCMKYLKDEDESKDAVMDIFEKLFKELKKSEVVNFKSWLFKVSVNHCLMMLRRKQPVFVREQNNLSEQSMESGLEIHLDGEMEVEDNIQLMEKGIEHLNDEQSVCIKLFYLEKKCYAEISEITGYDVNKVKSHLQNGKRNLRIYMERRE
jgi:RNA polymerase sigma factor (sigma-70 family)